MLGRLKGYTVRIISRKEAENEGFCAKAAFLSKKTEDEKMLEDMLEKKLPVFAVYDKKNELCEWFACEHTEGHYFLSGWHVCRTVPLVLQTSLENMILQELMSKAVFHHVNTIDWRKESYPVLASKVWQSAFLGVLFGVIMGFLFGWFTHSKPLGIAVAVLWSCASAMIFGSQELRKQQDTLEQTRLSAQDVQMKHS